MQRNCASCGVLYEAKRPNSKYHNDTCRKRGQRAPKVEMSLPELLVGLGSAPREQPLAAAASRELEAAGRLDTYLGQAALELARRISSPMETGASIASLVKQLRETMADALKGAATADDALDELRKRRDSKRATG